LRFFFGESCNKELFLILLNVKGGGVLRVRSKDHIGDGENFSCRLFSIIGIEFEGLTLIQDFTKEHFGLLILYLR
jgi:hypothetical protein